MKQILGDLNVCLWGDKVLLNTHGRQLCLRKRNFSCRALGKTSQEHKAQLMATSFHFYLVNLYCPSFENLKNNETWFQAVCFWVCIDVWLGLKAQPFGLKECKYRGRVGMTPPWYCVVSSTSALGSSAQHPPLFGLTFPVFDLLLPCTATFTR